LKQERSLRDNSMTRPGKAQTGTSGRAPEQRSSSAPDNPPFCPSAQPEMPGSVVFGVVEGTVEEPRLGYLDKPQPVTEELLALSGPVKPAEVFRFAAPCAGSACRHFDGADCTLAKKTAHLLPQAVDRLPPCRLRPRCRWWRQEGRAACMRCPMIVTEDYRPNEQQRMLADPAVDPS
jgi:hypothetical protein